MDSPPNKLSAYKKDSWLWVWGIPTYEEGENILMEQSFIKHGDDVASITGNVRCTNGDCPYINYVGCCTGNNENCEYRQQRNDAFLHYTFDGI